MTSPSAFELGISIQSPTRSMSLPESCMLATSDSSVSLKTSISTAVIAPRPDSSSSGSRLNSVAIIRITAMTNTPILTSCR